jgi:hypothetical protein
MLPPLEPETSNRRNKVLETYDEFRRTLSSYIAEAIERSKTELPPDFVAWAPGIVVASDHLLRVANYRPGSPPPQGWCLERPDVYTKVLRDNRLMVRGCGEFWTVEREVHEILVFNYGSQPVFTRSYVEAMHMAEFFHTNRCDPFPAFPHLRWIPWTPSGIRYS